MAKPKAFSSSSGRGGCAADDDVGDLRHRQRRPIRSRCSRLPGASTKVRWHPPRHSGPPARATLEASGDRIRRAMTRKSSLVRSFHRRLHLLRDLFRRDHHLAVEMAQRLGKPILELHGIAPARSRNAPSGAHRWDCLTRYRHPRSRAAPRHRGRPHMVDQLAQRQEPIIGLADIGVADAGPR